MDDNEKAPFEWMIDRDDREQLEKFYRSLDSLYAYLEAHDIEWPGKGRVLTSIVRNLSCFEQVYPINGSYYCFLMFLSLMLEVQGRRLRRFVNINDIKDAIDNLDTPLARRHAGICGAGCIDNGDAALVRQRVPFGRGTRLLSELRGQ